MHLLHEFKRRWPDSDNHIGFAILIFANVKLAKFALCGRVGEQKGIKIFGIKLKPIWGIVKRILNSLIDDGNRRIGSACFVQNQNPSDFLCGCRCNRAGHDKGCKSRKGKPEVTHDPSSSALLSSPFRPKA